MKHFSKYWNIDLLCFFVVHFQNGELSDGFAASLDVCIAKDISNDNTSSLLLALSEENVYDGLIDDRSQYNLKKTLIGIRKKTSEEVCVNLFLFHYSNDDDCSNILYHPKVKLVEVTECSLMSHHYNTCCKPKMDLSSDQSHMSKESARRILFRDFGGKKAMKVLDRKEKMKINVDAVKDQLDKTLLG